MFNIEVISAWIAVFLTLSIFSYLYDDNPFYKAAEHLFIGISAGYGVVIAFWQQVRPNLFGRLWPKLEENSESLFNQFWYGIYEILNQFNTLFGVFDRSVFPEGGIDGYDSIRFIYIIPFILGIFMLMRLIPSLGWLARWSIAYIVGMAAGLRFYGFLNSDILLQIKASTIDLSSDWGTIINSIIVFVGTLTGLIYFFFSKEHTGVVGRLSKIGIYFLMIKFGASFGFAVMGRISLLIGRIKALETYNSAEYYYSTIFLLILMTSILIFWTYKKNDREQLDI
tara:strand:- start:428 stop:1273 length:846 start_codon:yes stop_codon:yes gene_type:complete